MIEGKKVRLWSVEKEDLLKNYIWGNDPQIVSMSGMSPYPISFLEIERWHQNISSTTTSRTFAIKTHEGEYIGNVEISAIDWRSRKAEVGIIIGEKEHWNKGYGTEALSLIVDFAFGQMNLERLQANILDVNSNAMKLFEDLGFLKEGMLRNAFYSNGKFCGIILFGLLKNEKHSVG